MVEGIGRTLNPDLNLWQLAQPLIEDWVSANLSPEARLREGVEEGLTVLQRLPKLASDAEAALARVSEGGLRLHPETVAQLAQAKTGQRRGQTILWLAVAVGILAGAVLVL